jgi:hypothetical protein
MKDVFITFSSLRGRLKWRREPNADTADRR